MFNDPPKSPSLLIEQHEAAANEFGKAAHDVDDSEALRVLALLEQHHKQLASIIKTQIAPVEPILEEPKAAIPATKAQPITTALDVAKSATRSTANRVPSPVRSRRPPRDITSSIASNLANARGIPSQDPSQSRPRQLSPSERDSRSSQPPSRAQAERSAQHARQSVPKESAGAQRADRQTPQCTSPATTEDSFQKFYSTFEGIFSKISAPLAFAGLPLQPEEPASNAASTPLSARTTATSDDPAISRLFSRAALRAVKDNQSSAGVHDSFYVVPTSGGTVSYAGMLSSQQKPPARHVRSTSSASDTHDNYVDAHETQDRTGGPSSQPISVSASSRRPSSSVPTPALNSAPKKTLEELELENASLKQLTDKLSHRLYDWEKNAQNQSIALQASIRSLQGPGAHSGNPRRITHDTQMAPLVEEEEEEEARAVLEAALAHAQKDVEKYGRENEKLKTVVLRYRERWEKLKEGARVRREGAERDRERKADEGEKEDE